MCISNMYISLPLYFDEILFEAIGTKAKKQGMFLDKAAPGGS